MNPLTLCSNDPLVDMMREVFHANIVRVPEERIQPLCALAVQQGKTVYLGQLSDLLRDGTALGLQPDDYKTGAVADVSGKRSRQVDLQTQLQILEGFLKGFGVPSAGIEQGLQRASRVSFTFKNVRRTYVEPSRLGKALAGRTLDQANPLVSIFFGASPATLLVLDSVISSSDFSLSVDKSLDTNFKIDLPAIQSVLAQATTDLKATTSAGYDLIFQGTRFLTFAFSCLQFTLQPDGSIAALAPDTAARALALGDAEESGPPRVLITPQPQMLALDSTAPGQPA